MEGRRTAIAAELLLTLWAVALPGAAATPVHVESLPEGTRGELVLTAVDHPETVQRIPITGPDPSVSLPPGRWVVTTAIPGFWARPVTLVPGEPHEVRLLPTGLLKGMFAAEVSPDLPVAIEVWSPPSRGARAERIGRIACDVDRRTWRCEVPAGTHDIVLRPAGYIPHYRWDVAVETDRPTEMGEFTLERGASVSGSLENPPGHVRLRLVPQVVQGGTPQNQLRADQKLRIAHPDENGHFSILHVEPGSWILEATAPGYALTTAGPFDVHANEETRITTTLTLDKPGTLDVAILPPVDPDGHPWRTIMASHGGERRILRETAQADGSTAFTTLTPGRYSLTIEDSHGNRWSHETVDVRSGTNLHPVSLEIVTVSGVVRVDGEPVAATLFWGGRFGAHRVQMSSDLGGRYRGSLPRKTEWPLEVVAKEPAIESTRFITFEKEEADLRLDLDFAALSISGVVVDPEGRPVAQTPVTLATRYGSREAVTSEDGTFRFSGVDKGRYALMARDRSSGAASDRAEIEIVAGKPVTGLKLVLGRSGVLTGRVAAEGRPLAGVSVALIGDRGIPVSGRSDPRGEFELYPDDAITTGVLAIQAPGFGFAVRAYEPTGHINVEMIRARGSLLIKLAPGESRLDGLTIRRDGITLPMNHLLAWAKGHAANPPGSKVLEFPHLEAGSYEVCGHRLFEGKPRSSCRSVALTDGGRVELILSVVPPQERS